MRESRKRPDVSQLIDHKSCIYHCIWNLRWVFLVFSPSFISQAVSANGLLINEIGSNYDPKLPAWVELVNTSGATIDLAGISLRSPAVDCDGNSFDSETFELPPIKIKAGAFLLVRGRTLKVQKETYYDSQVDTAYIEKNGKVPFWSRTGFIELIKGGQSIDFVTFGEKIEIPDDKNAWNRGAAFPLRYDKAGVGTSLARCERSVDTNSALDWTDRSFATPYGPNDSKCREDLDEDGIPDCAEQPGGTFAGLPLYDWGARAGIPDIFVEVDYMESDNPGVNPRSEALASVRRAFAKKGIKLHFDAGDLYSGIPVGAADFNLGGGNQVPFEEYIKLRPKDGFKSLYHYKAVHMDPRRKPIFHYLLFANSQKECNSKCTTINYSKSCGKTGKGEINGQDSIVTLGCWGLSDDSTEISTGMSKLNELINVQSGTIMHELGHNFGLMHGGGQNEPRNQPNYLSVMNYLYQANGLDDPDAIDAGTRFFIENKKDCGEKHLDKVSGSPFGLPTDFMLDYSDGRGKSLDERNVNESIGLGRQGTPINFDCDDDTKNGYAMELDNSPAYPNVLKDYDDWGNIDLSHGRRKAKLYEGLIEFCKVRYYSSSLFDVPAIDVINSRWPIIDDQQPVAEEHEVPMEMINGLRNEFEALKSNQVQ